MNQDIATKLKQLLVEPLYEDLVEWMSKQLRDLKNIDNVRELPKAQDQALELKAQKKAYDKLDAIFSTIMFIKKEEVPNKDKGNDYGV